MAIRKKTKKLIALLFILLMIHSTLPLHVFAQDDAPPTETVPGDDIGTGDPPVEDPGTGDTGEPPMTDAPGAAAAGGEPGEFSSLAASAPEIAGMSGAAAYRIPISVPPGRANLAPNLGLTYNSSLRNSWIAVGWSLDLGAIQRNTKNGLDYGARDFVATINGSTSELVERTDWGDNCFGSKIEGPFMRFCLDRNSANLGKWTVWSKDGTQYSYGASDASQQKNELGIFRWRLDTVTDTSAPNPGLGMRRARPDVRPHQSQPARLHQLHVLSGHHAPRNQDALADKRAGRHG